MTVDGFRSSLEVCFSVLTEEESRVAEEFAEHQTLGGTLRALGWSGPGQRNRLREILGRPGVREAVQASMEFEQGMPVGGSAEVMRFWTTVMRDGQREYKSRLKASELLGRAHGVIGEQAGKLGVVFVGSLNEQNTKAVESLLERFGRRIEGPKIEGPSDESEVA